jgi:CRISPR-associated protein (TIGR03985 family)
LENPQPILLDCQKFPIPQIVYPVGFVYIQRAPYLYFIYQQDENSINWDAVRSDRITNVEVLNWNDNNIPSLLKQQKEASLPNCYDILDYFEGDKALGYAFWKTKSWAILRFNREHYTKYIEGTSRDSYLTNLEEYHFDSLQSLIERETKKLNQYIESDINNDFYKHQGIKLKEEQLADLKLVEKIIQQSHSSKKPTRKSTRT